jgi:hypothetical protein
VVEFTFDSVRFRRLRKNMNVSMLRRVGMCWCVRFQSPLEVAVLAIERMEKMGRILVGMGDVSGSL